MPETPPQGHHDDPAPAPAKGKARSASGGKLGDTLKQAAAWSGLCYVFGFVIINASLANLGTYDFSLASSRVLAAGLLYVGLCALSGVGWGAALAVAVSKPVKEWTKRKSCAASWTSCCSNDSAHGARGRKKVSRSL